MNFVNSAFRKVFKNPIIRAGVIATMIPTMGLVVLANLAEDVSDDDAMIVAAQMLRHYVDDNPPNGVWEATDVSIGPEHRLTIDVNVPIFKHAQVIRSRNDRIKYSYLKLACPTEAAKVHKYLPSNSRVWVKLHHYGEKLAEAPCPQSRGGATLTG